MASPFFLFDCRTAYLIFGPSLIGLTIKQVSIYGTSSNMTRAHTEYGVLEPTIYKKRDPYARDVTCRTCTYLTCQPEPVPTLTADKAANVAWSCWDLESEEGKLVLRYTSPSLHAQRSKEWLNTFAPTNPRAGVLSANQATTTLIGGIASKTKRRGLAGIIPAVPCSKPSEMPRAIG